MIDEGRRYERLRALAASHGQGHIFRFWDRLDAAGRARLLDDVETVDFALLARLVAGEGIASPPDPAGLRPAPVERPDRRERERAVCTGLEALAEGRVAGLLLAGGQGTRLGYPGPKGTLPVGPVSGRTLFEIHAARLRALSAKIGRAIPLIVLVSDANEEATRAYFEERGALGLPDVHFLRQRSLPAVDRDGRLILEAPDRIFRSPDGHGGALEALVESGEIDRLRTRGIAHLFTYQVDNILAMPCDPVFVGIHLARGAEFSSKMVRKVRPDEGLAVCAERDGVRAMIEYSDLPAAMMEARGEDGELLYWAGSIAIHLLRLDLIERIARDGAGLPYHRARKKVPYADETGGRVEPAEENGTKFERFIFDALPIARVSLNLEVEREEEFAPIKRAEGPDSLPEAQRRLSRLHARWLRATGARIPLDGRGDPRVPVEIDPLFALGPEDLPADAGAGIRPGGPIYLEGEG